MICDVTQSAHLDVTVKIVSLLPSATEIAVSIGLGQELVAVSHECDHPAEIVDDLPRITSGIDLDGFDSASIDTAIVEAVNEGRAIYQIDGELLVDLGPDLLITQGICDVCAVDDNELGRTLRMLPDVLADVTTVTLRGATWDGILHDIVTVGAATARQDHATAVTDLLKDRWRAIEPVEPSRRVLFLEWADPFFIGGHWVPEQIAAAGGIDVIGRPGKRSRRVAVEDLDDLDPEVVVMAACGYDTTGNAEFAASLPTDFGATEIWAVDANSYFSRPGPRIVGGAEILRSIFGGNPVDSSAAVRVA